MAEATAAAMETMVSSMGSAAAAMSSRAALSATWAAAMGSTAATGSGNDTTAATSREVNNLWRKLSHEESS